MDRGERHGLITGLRNGDRDEVDRLLVLCNRSEGLDLPIFLTPTAAAGGVATDLLLYDHGKLVGYAWLPHDPEPEACLMVHPDHRRRGIGRALVAAARAEGRRRGLPGFVLVCDEASPSAKAFVTAMGARYRSSEFRLELDRGAIDRSRPRHPAVQLRQAGAGDVATLTRLLAASFGASEHTAREQATRGLRESKRRYYVATLSGDPVGMVQAGEWEGSAGITALGVLPEYRGRGIGRQVLTDVVDVLLAEGWERVLIEVATDNQGALGLYRSCGFKVATEYGFYDLAV